MFCGVDEETAGETKKVVQHYLQSSRPLKNRQRNFIIAWYMKRSTFLWIYLYKSLFIRAVWGCMGRERDLDEHELLHGLHPLQQHYTGLKGSTQVLVACVWIPNCMETKPVITHFVFWQESQLPVKCLFLIFLKDILLFCKATAILLGRPWWNTNINSLQTFQWAITN